MDPNAISIYTTSCCDGFIMMQFSPKSNNSFTPIFCQIRDAAVGTCSYCDQTTLRVMGPKHEFLYLVIALKVQGQCNHKERRSRGPATANSTDSSQEKPDYENGIPRLPPCSLSRSSELFMQYPPCSVCSRLRVLPCSKTTSAEEPTCSSDFAVGFSNASKSWVSWHPKVLELESAMLCCLHQEWLQLFLILNYSEGFRHLREYKGFPLWIPKH